MKLEEDGKRGFFFVVLFFLEFLVCLKYEVYI